LASQRPNTVNNVRVLYGVEASLFANGTIDFRPPRTHHVPVIASRHALPKRVEYKPKAVMKLFEQTCRNPVVDILGHPERNIEQMKEVDWPQVFAWAAETGTAVEVNFNCFPHYSDGPAKLALWSLWVETLAHSNAIVAIGSDIHNQNQLSQFVSQWKALDHVVGRDDNHLAHFLEMLVAVRLNPERVITADYESFTTWITTKKADRPKISM
jgi:histidinol phosphatase-like PHP family hydrolase